MTTATIQRDLPTSGVAEAGPDPSKLLRAITKRSFATLATTSESEHPHVAGILYEAVGTTLYVNTLRTSRKARNVATNPKVAVVIPVRRLPVGPPSTIQFQGRADLLDVDSTEIQGLVADGQLRSITSHGELDLPESCFVRITPGPTLFTHGLGMSLISLIRHPLDAGRHVALADVQSS